MCVTIEAEEGLVPWADTGMRQMLLGCVARVCCYGVLVGCVTMEAEAGLVPWADTGMRQMLRCLSPRDS